MKTSPCTARLPILEEEWANAMDRLHAATNDVTYWRLALQRLKGEREAVEAHLKKLGGRRERQLKKVGA